MSTGSSRRFTSESSTTPGVADGHDEEQLASRRASSNCAEHNDRGTATRKSFLAHVATFSANFALPVASGILLSMCYPPWDWGHLAWLALVPLAISLTLPRGGLAIGLGAYAGGLVFQLAHLDWIRTGYGDVGFTGPRAVQWLWQGILLALVWPPAVFIGRWFVRRSAWPLAIAFPLIWISFEFARKHLWSIVDATGYPFGQLGLALADQVRLIQVADLGGVYAVSALVASVNGCIADCCLWVMQSRSRGTLIRPWPTVSAFVATAALGGAWVYGTWRLSQPVDQNGPLVCLMPERALNAFQDPVVSSLPSTAEGSWPNLRDGAQGRPDLLLWSETAFPGDISSLAFRASSEASAAPSDAFQATATSPTLSPTTTARSGQSTNAAPGAAPPRARMEAMARAINASLVVGYDRRVEQGGGCSTYNSAAFIGSQCGYVGSYDKVWLIPFSEFHPPGRPAFGGPSPDRYVHGEQYPVFDVSCGPESRSRRVAIVICYDMCFPESCWPFMGALAAEPPDCFVVPAYESHDQEFRLQKLILRLAQFRAIECRRAFVRNAKGGYSGMISSNGVLITQPPRQDFDDPHVLGCIPVDRRYSLYAAWHDWMPATALGLIALVVLAPRRTKASQASGHFVRTGDGAVERR